MEFKNKKILLLCKETFSYPLYFLAKKWSEKNEVAAFFFMPAECKYAESLLNTTTYYAYKRLEKVKVYDVCEIADEFTNYKHNPQIDVVFLKEIEKKYTNFKNLNTQLMSSQFTTRQFHFRNYMQLFTHEQQMYWLQLNYKRIIQILEEFQPDMIIDYDDAELPRAIINEVAYRKNIPYITIEHPRYDNYKLFTFQMGIGRDKYFEEAYRKALNKSNEELKEELQYVEEFRRKTEIMPEEYKNTITAKYEKDNWFTLFKVLLGKFNYFRNQDKVGNNKKIKKENTLLYPSSKEYLKFYLRTCLLSQKLYGKNEYFENPVEGEKYVYMPLHLIPESTTFVKAPMYVNELNIIEAVSKALPVDWKLYVKEHQAMLGERSVEFYKVVKKLPNVRLVQLNYYKDPKPWIANAKGVITITGTGAYEAALMGKKALIFGDIPFGVLDGITRVRSFEDLPELFEQIDDVIENQKSCAAYISAVKEEGMSIRYKYLMLEGENILFGKTKISQEFLKEIDVLEEFYVKAYEKFQKV